MITTRVTCRGPARYEWIVAIVRDGWFVRILRWGIEETREVALHHVSLVLGEVERARMEFGHVSPDGSTLTLHLGRPLLPDHPSPPRP